MQRAIDISNYTGHLDGAAVDYLRRAASFVVVRLSTEDVAGQRDIAASQVGTLADAGIPWQGYLWCYWDDDPYQHWQLAQERLPAGWAGYHRLGIWLDMEDNCPNAAAALEWVGAYASLLTRDEFVPGVYTGRWWIDQHPAAFAGGRTRYWTQYPLWWASYGVAPSCYLAGIGPWERVAMHQYQSVDRGAYLSSYDLSQVCAEI